MKKENLKIIATARGVEYSLVAIKDLDFNYIYISIQHNKHISTNPKICLISNMDKFSKFVNRINSEITSPTVPDLKTVTTLQCDSFCELLKITKIQHGEYEALMYYNYRRPKTKRCADSVALTNVDLEKFIKSLEGEI